MFIHVDNNPCLIFVASLCFGLLTQYCFGHKVFLFWLVMIIKPITLGPGAPQGSGSDIRVFRVSVGLAGEISALCCFYKKLILREDKSEWLEQQICECCVW